MLAIDKTSFRLPEDQYVPERFPKDLIVIHHTVGRDARSSFEWLKADPQRIATAFLIGQDGTVYELFPPDCWAWHVGGHYGSRLERRSIGIELDCEGPLVKRGESFFAFADEKRNVKGVLYYGAVYALAQPWRGWQYFAAYTPEQFASLLSLLQLLLVEFVIPAQTTKEHVSGTSSLADFRGVLGHAELRPDKTDPHPGLDWVNLVGVCGLRTVEA